jgi:hypothetical protein
MSDCCCRAREHPATIAHSGPKADRSQGASSDHRPLRAEGGPEPGSIQRPSPTPGRRRTGARELPATIAHSGLAPDRSQAPPLHYRQLPIPGGTFGATDNDQMAFVSIRFPTKNESRAREPQATIAHFGPKPDRSKGPPAAKALRSPRIGHFGPIAKPNIPAPVLRGLPQGAYRPEP